MKIRQRRKKMMRYLKILFLSMVVIGLMTGSAFAGTVGNTYGVPPTNTATTVATELFPAAGYSKADHLKVFYNSTADFVANDVVTFTFSNVALTETAFNLCNATTDSATPVAAYLGSIDATSGVSTLIFRFSAPLANTQTLYIAKACEVAGEYTTPANILDVKFPQLTATQNATVSAAATFGTGISIPGATAAAVNLYTVQNQYSITAPALKTSTVDFAQDMKKIVVAAPDTATLATANSITLADSAPVLPAALVATDKAVLTLAASMSGIARICYDDAACLATSATRFTIDTVANTATYSRVLTTPAIGDLNHKLTFVVDGTTPLSERTFKLTALLDLTGADKLDRTLLSAVSYFRLQVISAQYYIPLIGSVPASGRETYIKLQSKNTAAGANGVSVAILASDGSITATYSAGTITPGVPMLITGAQLVTAATNAGKTVDGAAGFAVIVTVNAPEADVFAYANMIEASGAKRIPVKTVSGTIVE
jgi:hypothetical protein